MSSVTDDMSRGKRKNSSDETFFVGFKDVDATVPYKNGNHVESRCTLIVHLTAETGTLKLCQKNINGAKKALEFWSGKPN